MEENTLRDITQMLRKRLWLIIAITVIATAAAGIYSYFFITPNYQTSTQLLVSQAKDEDTFNPGEMGTDLQLINTYNVIIKSPAILDKVKTQLKLDQSIADQITVASEQDSQVVKITVRDIDPKVAADIANTTAYVFSNEIVKIMKVDNVSILSMAEVNSYPVSPNPPLNLAIGFVVGLMLSVGLVFLLEYLDNTLKAEQDIERVLELPVLGTITEIDLELENSSPKKDKRGKRGGTIGA